MATKKSKKKSEKPVMSEEMIGALEATATEATATEATAPAKKTRKPRENLIMKYKDSPTGHFADVTFSIVARLDKLLAKAGKWDPKISAYAEESKVGLGKLLGVFNELEEAGFKPSRSNAKKPFQPGNMVKLDAKALALLQKDFPTLSNDHVILVALSMEDGDKSIPLSVANDDGSPGQFLGRVSKKFLSRV